MAKVKLGKFDFDIDSAFGAATPHAPKIVMVTTETSAAGCARLEQLHRAAVKHLRICSVAALAMGEKAAEHLGQVQTLSICTSALFRGSESPHVLFGVLAQSINPFPIGVAAASLAVALDILLLLSDAHALTLYCHTGLYDNEDGSDEKWLNSDDSAMMAEQCRL